MKRPEYQGCDSVYWIYFLLSGSWAPQCHVESLQPKIPSVYFLFAHVREWPLMPSRNLLDCLCSALLSVYQITGGSSHSWWIIANVKALHLSDETSLSTQSVEDTHQTLSILIPPLIPFQVFNCVIVHPRADFWASLLLSHMKGCPS